MTVTEDRPFLSIMTRTHKRPRRLQECKESVAQLVDDDYEHVVVVDEVGVGHDGSYKLCIDAFDDGRVNGQYVWFLDDVNGSGRIFLTHTKLDGQLVLRMSIGQTYTDAPHVERAWEMIRTAADRVGA